MRIDNMIRITHYARQNLKELDPDDPALKVIYCSTKEELDAYNRAIVKLSMV